MLACKPLGVMLSLKLGLFCEEPPFGPGYNEVSFAPKIAKGNPGPV